jgi:hypothetical protein
MGVNEHMNKTFVKKEENVLEPKRYDPNVYEDETESLGLRYYSAVMDESQNGKYVLYSDFLKLKEHFKNLEEAF